MIEPKFREMMTRVVVGPFTIRVWWKSGVTDGAFTIDKLHALLNEWAQRVYENTLDVPDMERLILASGFEDMTAYEILVTHTGNGVVGYLEWP